MTAAAMPDSGAIKKGNSINRAYAHLNRIALLSIGISVLRLRLDPVTQSSRPDHVGFCRPIRHTDASSDAENPDRHAQFIPLV